MIFCQEMKNLFKSKATWLGLLMIIAFTVQSVVNFSEAFSLRNSFQYAFNSQSGLRAFICILVGYLSTYAAVRDTNTGSQQLIAAAKVRRRSYFWGRCLTPFVFGVILLFLTSFVVFLVWHGKIFALD